MMKNTIIDIGKSGEEDGRQLKQNLDVDQQ
jgi:hypothetical protein